MSSYKPPYTITSKILRYVAKISEEITKLEMRRSALVNPRLRKTNRIKTVAGTLEIEGNLLGEEKVTAILEGKRVLGTMREITEVEGAIAAYQVSIWCRKHQRTHRRHERYALGRGG